MISATHVQLPEEWANPALLRWARLRMGLDVRQVESETKLPAERVSSWEEAEEAPTLAELEVLAKLYACPVGYFFLDLPPDDKLPLELRGLAQEKIDVLSYKTRLRLRQFVEMTEQAALLVKDLGISWQVRFETANLEQSVVDIAREQRQQFDVTPETREHWRSTDEAFDFWRTAIENRGVFVVALTLNPQEVRGASKWEPQQPPAILVNRSDIEAAAGRLFTLLHEWAHLLVKHAGLVCDFRGQQGSAKVEHFANMFAAEVLAPRDELADFLRREGLFERRSSWGDPTLDKIRRPFKVSRDVIAILLEEMNLAPAGFYRKKRAMWDKRKPFFASRGTMQERRGQTKVRRKLEEIGLPLGKLFAEGYEKGALSSLDVADFLDMRVEQAERFLAWVRGGAEHPDEV